MRIGLSVLMLGLTLGPAVASAQDRYADLESCELAAAGGRITASARCGTLAVPENPTAPEGRQLELAYAVLPARASNAAPDPVFFLAGGPGQSAREMLPFMRHALREINAERDLIFLDQRGTGESNPLNCDSEQTEEVWLDANYDQMAEQIDACRATWDADLRFYTTSDAARDLESLRIHYGFEQINLIGGSYGTRLAQVYLRNYPDQVRTVILDGVVPTRLHLGSEHGIMLDRALGKLFDLCASDTTCDSTFPDLGSAFDSLKARFPDPDRGPQIQVTHPRRGVAVEMPFNRSTLAAALRFLAYSPQTQMMIPYLVHEASTTGDPTRLASQAMIVTDQMADAIAIGLNFAVGCAEDWPGWPEVDGQADTLLGNSMKIVYDQICADWPSAEAPDDFHVPFDTSTPVLLLSGELDPVTPPSYGDEAAAQYSNSLHLVAQGRGHIVITEDCIGQIASRFVKAADLSSLDAQCMDGLGPEPFFIDLLGPTP